VKSFTTLTISLAGSSIGATVSCSVKSESEGEGEGEDEGDERWTATQCSNASKYSGWLCVDVIFSCELSS
jgi:hypothetical protein